MLLVSGEMWGLKSWGSEASSPELGSSTVITGEPRSSEPGPWLHLLSALPRWGARLTADEGEVRSGVAAPRYTPKMRTSRAHFQVNVKSWWKDFEKIQMKIFLDGIDWAGEGPVSMGKVQSSPTWPW